MMNSMNCIVPFNFLVMETLYQPLPTAVKVADDPLGGVIVSAERLKAVRAIPPTESCQ